MQNNKSKSNKHATSHFFFLMPLAYLSTLYSFLSFSLFFLLRPLASFLFFFSFLCFSWPLATLFFSFPHLRLSAIFFYFFPNVACFHNIQSIQFKGDMQLYVIDTFSHIGQGGMKKNKWPKGVESKDI